MHVLILPSWYFQQGTAQLNGRMFQQHAHALRKANIDARILYGEFTLSQPINKRILHAHENNVPTWRVSEWFPPKINAYLAKLWVKKYAAAIEDYMHQQGRPDLIHAQSYFTGAVASFIKNKFNIPYVYTERLSSVLANNIPGRFVPLIRSALQNAALNTAVSPGLKKSLHAFTDKPIEVIPNFYDGEIFYSDPSIEKYQTFTWVTVGEPAHIKGLDLFLQAYGELRNKIGSGKMQIFMIDEIREKKPLMRIVNQYNMDDEIKWTGKIPQTEIASCLRRSHVYVSASRIETFGKSILEALACGTYVIATKTDGAQYILDSDANKLVELNNSAALCNAMEYAFRNYTSLSTNVIGSSLADRFSENAVIEKWGALYNQIVT